MTVRAAVFLVGVATAGLPAVVHAAEAEASVPAGGERHLAFTILMDGDPVGHETYALSRSGDRTTIKVHTDSKAHVLFLTFTYRHDRTEVWRDGHIESFVADTDDDGTRHRIEARRVGEALKVVADGKTMSLPGDAVPFTIWGKGILGHARLYSIIDFQAYDEMTERLGQEKLTLGGRSIPVEHDRLTGGLVRDLWYDSEGLLVKAAFTHRGYPVQFVRTQDSL